MTTAEFTGGAMIGWVNVSWPLAKLRVEPEELEVKAAFIGTHRFARKDVREIVQVTWLPVLAWGVRIRHVREYVPASVIFWCFGSPKRILDAVSRSGFSPTARDAPSPRSGFPFRMSFVVAALAIWNGLFLLDRALHHGVSTPPTALPPSAAAVPSPGLVVPPSATPASVVPQDPPGLPAAEPSLGSICSAQK